MPANLWSLYTLMLKSRLLEEAITKLWHDGLISGEMHLGTGEEAINAGVVAHLREGDAMALDHRGTSPLMMRGVDPILILRELLGSPDGLCGGRGGHMHLFSKELFSASSGIVGASGPTAAGFALSAQYLCPGAVAVAFFGEGAMNQGMLLESMNLASAWSLPVLFVCKDDGWSITAQSKDMTGGNLKERARGLGIPAEEVDGLDVLKVWEAAASAIGRARSGRGPAFLQARCVHFEGHFLGFQPLRLDRHPLKEIPRIAIPLTRSFLRSGGAGWRERLAGMKTVLKLTKATRHDPRRDQDNDPIRRARRALRSDHLRIQDLEDRIKEEIRGAVASALQGVSL